jgi:hypothetical protein
VLEIPEVSLERGVFVLEPVPVVDRDPPVGVGLKVGENSTVPIDHLALQHEAAGISHHRARRPEQGRPVGDARHVEHDHRQDVPPAPQVRGQVVGIIEVVVDVTLGRAATEAGAVAIKDIPAVG